MDESRRDLIKKAAVGTGIVWAAPVLSSAVAYAAGTPQPTTSSTQTTSPVGCATADASLDGVQEVPPNASPGQGVATFTFDDTSLQLCMTGLEFGDLVGTTIAAHIHGPAAPGVNAPILFPLTIPLGVTSGSAGPQCFTLTPTQRDQFCAELFYVNIHTTFRPGGEIRGQMETA